MFNQNDVAQMENMTVMEKYNFFSENEWTYIPDPNTFSGGVWMHEELGFVNNGGGTFSRINEAVEALERFIYSLQMCGR